MAHLGGHFNCQTCSVLSKTLLIHCTHCYFLHSFIPRLLCRGGGKRAWYTLFAHTLSSLGNQHTTLLHWNLRSISAYLLKGHTAWLYYLWDTYGQFWSQKQYHSNSLHCFVRGDWWTWGKDCVIHVSQCLAGMDKHVDNSCKWRAEYVCCSFVIIHTERGQWQASFMWEKWMWS